MCVCVCVCVKERFLLHACVFVVLHIILLMQADAGAASSLKRSGP